jgi:uncharacterized protein
MIKSFSLALLLGLMSAASFALDKANIQVSAEASVEMLPDYLQFSVQIAKTGNNKAELKNQVDRISQQVLDAADKLSIPSQQIDAASIYIAPEYKWQNNQNVLIGDNVRRTINIKLYQLEQYTALVDAIAKLDITSMSQASYGFEKQEQAKQQALVEALNKAKQKANLIAETMGQKLGKAYQIVENHSGYTPVYQPRLMAMAADSAESKAAPLEVKAQTISQSVSVIFLLK